jgi:hypothetical protein
VSYSEADRRPQPRYDTLWLLGAAIAMVLLIYAAALSVVIEFAYRHLIAAPKGKLLGWLR